MPKQGTPSGQSDRFVRCVKGDGCALITGKRYRVVPDEKEEQRGFLRVIDESGEDYLFLATLFEVD